MRSLWAIVLFISLTVGNNLSSEQIIYDVPTIETTCSSQCGTINKPQCNYLFSQNSQSHIYDVNFDLLKTICKRLEGGFTFQTTLPNSFPSLWKWVNENGGTWHQWDTGFKTLAHLNGTIEAFIKIQDEIQKARLYIDIYLYKDSTWNNPYEGSLCFVSPDYVNFEYWRLDTENSFIVGKDILMGLKFKFSDTDNIFQKGIGANLVNTNYGLYTSLNIESLFDSNWKNSEELKNIIQCTENLQMAVDLTCGCECEVKKRGYTGIGSSSNNCYWNDEWSDWAECDAYCGGGKTYRTKQCSCSGSDGFCYGEQPYEESLCNQDPCCFWEETWGECDVECGGGYAYSDIVCKCPYYNFPYTDEACMMYEKRPSNRKRCNEIDCCYWEWSGWYACSALCDDGIALRKAECKCPYYDFPYGDDACAMYSPRPREYGTCNNGPCCYWDQWIPLTDCQTQCGNGTYLATKSCHCPYYESYDTSFCSRYSQRPTERVYCYNGPCCEWGAWSEWSSCSAKCGDGVISRRSTCSCPGSDYPSDMSLCWDLGDVPVQTQPCNIQDCCHWGSWNAWGDCSATCGTGTRSRSSDCICPFNSTYIQSPSYCPNNQPIQTEDCNTQPCCEFSGWSSWSTCSRTCDGGTYTRSEICSCPDVTVPYDESLCESVLNRRAEVQLETCNEFPCCYYGDWSSWSTCSVGCGGGTTYRTQNCICPTLSNGDTTVVFPPVSCENLGPQPIQNTTCNEINCCTWGSWSSWSPCNASCGGSGVISRTHNCICGEVIAPPNQCGALQLSDYFQTQPCMGISCCDWQWTSSNCSVPCGGGTMIMTQQCYCDGTLSDNSNCVGQPLVLSQTCNESPCVGEGVCGWVWSPWMSCQYGTQTRYPKCSCADVSQCNATEIPLPDVRDCTDCDWQWGGWGVCSVPCGSNNGSGGIQTRIQVCMCPDFMSNDVADPNNCAGVPRTEQQTCNTNLTCCVWTDWGPWGDCSDVCSGTHSRYRDCSCPNILDCLPDKFGVGNIDSEICTPGNCPKATPYWIDNIGKGVWPVGENTHFTCYLDLNPACTNYTWAQLLMENITNVPEDWLSLARVYIVAILNKEKQHNNISTEVKTCIDEAGVLLGECNGWNSTETALAEKLKQLLDSYNNGELESNAASQDPPDSLDPNASSNTSPDLLGLEIGLPLGVVAVASIVTAILLRKKFSSNATGVDADTITKDDD